MDPLELALRAAREQEEKAKKEQTKPEELNEHAHSDASSQKPTSKPNPLAMALGDEEESSVQEQNTTSKKKSPLDMAFEADSTTEPKATQATSSTTVNSTQKSTTVTKPIDENTDFFSSLEDEPSTTASEMKSHTTSSTVENASPSISIEEKAMAIQAQLEEEVKQSERTHMTTPTTPPLDQQEGEIVETPIEETTIEELDEIEEVQSTTLHKMYFDRKDLSDETLIHLYKALLKPRLIEERMLIALRQGKITKWFSAYGQEAISVGIAEAIQQDEYLLPLHRNLGLFTSRKLDLVKLFAQFQGKKDGFTKGRDRSFHFGTNEHHIVGMISHLGPQLAVANGISLADILEKKHRITVTFSGDGATSEGDFHEALNVAAVWDLPTLFVVENNGYGLSTPSHEQFRCKQFIDKGIGYGMKAVQVDGNNILDVYHTVKELAEQMRTNPHPVLLEAITFRMRGHEEASGTKYVPQELFEVWKEKDPVSNYEKFLLEEGVLTEVQVKEIRDAFFAEIRDALDTALAQPKIQPNTEEEIADMYAPHEQELIAPISGSQSEKRFVDAISDALRQSMERYPKMTIMGQDVADYGGVFKITEGFVDSFGKERVRNTPLCESAIVGAGLGLSIRRWKSVIEMQFADFVTCGFNQIVNNLAKAHYRWGQNADVVVRMPTGAGVAAGPYHSQSNEAWFFHTPGLKVVYPSSPYDAKGLLNASIEDPNPVIFFEHKALYRSISEEIYDDYYTLPIGKASLVQEGYDVSIITYGMGVHWAKKAAKELGETYSLEIVDLRTLLPWDKETVAESVKKTGKVFILHEDCLTGGIGGEISAWIAEHCFNNLDAPIMREGSLDTAVPFNADLEQNFLPYNRFVEKLKKLVDY